MKRQLKTILGWFIASLIIVIGLALRALTIIAPFAVAIFIGLWLYHHV